LIFQKVVVNQFFLAYGQYIITRDEWIPPLAEYPETWPEIDKGIRKRVVRRFPYSILYQIYNNEIIIVAIVHHKQKPHYWIDRL